MIHFAIATLRPYLYGRAFTVKSDRKPLIFLYNLKNPASKPTRVRLELEKYDSVVEYQRIRGKDNVAADALSRISFSDLKEIYAENPESILAIPRSMSKRQNIATENYISDDRVNKTSVIEELGSHFDGKVQRVKTTAIHIRKNWLAITQLSAERFSISK